MKIQMESLLNGKTIEVNFDEQIVFSHLAQDESAVWSLLVAGGYLKVEDVDVMNYCMNKITLATFSYFDVGSEGAGNQEPERFYHGFVLGLIAERAEDYEIRSNRESGFGRYDIMMIPKDIRKYPAIIIEFKVCGRMKKETMEDAVQSALKQIAEKNYDAELLSQGIPADRIRHYGFAFEGKKVLIGTEPAVCL